MTVANPALGRFIDQIGSELTLAQVLITRHQAGYGLRHVADRERPADQLTQIPLFRLRILAQFTSAGRFRPLKAAPTLATGWQATVGSDQELGEALQALYPGAVADWHAAQAEQPPVTNARAFLGRQTGIYRTAGKLDDPRLAAVIRATCHVTSCLKRRCWAAPGAEPDPAETKSLIPCLEPCALLLEAARKAAAEPAPEVAAA